MCQSITDLFRPSIDKLYPLGPPGTYAYWVRQATRLISKAPGGDWRILINDNPRPEKDRFDRAYWQSIGQGTANDLAFKPGDPRDDADLKWGESILQVRADRTPAEAVDAILSSPENLAKWNIECDMTVQIASLFAIRQIIGTEEFNKRATTSMRLRRRESDGLKTVAHYARDKPDEAWQIVSNYEPLRTQAVPGTKNMVQDRGPFTFAGLFEPGYKTDEVVANAPVGSRIRWTNLNQPLFDHFRHENCIKLAQGLYAAKGVEAPYCELERDQLERKLAATTEFNDVSRIFIDEVEVFAQK